MTSAVYRITQGHANHLGICCIYVELLRDGLWDIRDRYILVQGLKAELLRCLNDNGYKRNHVIFHKLYDVYILKKRNLEKIDCDITALYAVLRHICTNLPAPGRGWSRVPIATDIEIADDIERIRLGRNDFIGHSGKASISTTDFKDQVDQILEVVKRIDAYLGSSRYVDGLNKILSDCQRNISGMDEYKKYRDLLDVQIQFEKENKMQLEAIQANLGDTQKNVEENRLKIMQQDSEIASLRRELKEHAKMCVKKEDQDSGGP